MKWWSAPWVAILTLKCENSYKKLANKRRIAGRHKIGTSKEGGTESEKFLERVL